MKSRLLFVLPLLLLSLTAFYVAPPRKVLVIQQCPDALRPASGDTIYVQYCNAYGPFNINDSIRKHCGADTLAVRTIFIANPAHVIGEMRFAKRFPRLSHLILVGNDASYIDTVRYDFFHCSSLERITFSAVYLEHEHEGKRGEKAMRQFVKSKRPDVRVRFKPMGWKDHVGWPDLR